MPSWFVLVKRKPGMSAEEFRYRYENGHSRTAIQLFGHLWSRYRRHYLSNGRLFAHGGKAMAADGPELPFDAISEIMFPDIESLQEMARIGAQPDVAHMLHEDEKTLFDRERSWGVITDCVEEDLPKARAAVAGLSLPVQVVLPQGFPGDKRM